MKKIILAVASVLALGLVVGCKQQIEGSLNVTATNYNKSLDYSTSKTFYYKASGTITTTVDTTEQYKAAGANSTIYTSRDRKTVTTYTPSGDVKVVISEPANDNVITYTYTVPYTYEKVVTGTIYSNVSGVANTTVKYVYNKDYPEYVGARYSDSFTIKIYKIDGKYYADEKAVDGSEIVVSEGFDPLAATVALSKFSDTKVKEEISWTKVADTSANLQTNVPTDDWTNKTTTKTSGKVSTISLEKK